MGWTGVDVFFVLSGFLVGGLMMKEWKKTGKVDAFRFLKRRAFKIWPGYYFFLLVAAVVHARPYNTFLWQNLFNVQNYFASSLSHTWSLAVEEHFYLTLAGLFAVVSARNWKPSSLLAGCFGFALLVECLRGWMVVHHKNFFFATHSRIDALLLGVALACIRTFYPEWFARLQRQRVLLCAVVALALVRLYVDKDAIPYPESMTSPWLITIVDYASAALLLLIYRPGGKHRLPYRVVARIGVFSYGIYLWHVSVMRPVDWVLAHCPPQIVPAVSTLLPYIIAIPLGIVATKAVELPFLRLRERMVPPTIPEPGIPTGSLAVDS